MCCCSGQYIYVGFSWRKIPCTSAYTIAEKAIQFRHPDYNPDRAQKLISSSMSRHLSTRNISSKSMHAFLSNLANKQTDWQMHLPPPLSEVKKWLSQCHRSSRLHAYHHQSTNRYWRCLYMNRNCQHRSNAQCKCNSLCTRQVVLAYVWHSHTVYKLAYSRRICMTIIITVYQWMFVLAIGQPIKFPTYYTK